MRVKYTQFKLESENKSKNNFIQSFVYIVSPCLSSPTTLFTTDVFKLFVLFFLHKLYKYKYVRHIFHPIVFVLLLLLRKIKLFILKHNFFYIT